MRLALLWALGLLGAGSPRPSPPLPNIGGTEEEQQASPERTLSGSMESRVVQDSPPMSLADVLQTGLPEALRISLELDSESHVLELLQNRDLIPGRPTLVWYQPDGTRMVSEGYSLENCCYRGRVQGHPSSWVSLCACSGIRGLIVLSPERGYTLELGPGDLQRPVISRIQDHLLLGHTCAPSWHASVPTRAGPDLLLEQHHAHRLKRDVVTETKIVELVIVADNSEVRKYPDFQQLLNRTLEAALLLDTFFQPLNVRVALVGLEAWTQHNLIEMSSNPAVLLDNFLRWRRTDLLPRLPHDSAQLVTVTSFSGPMVGMAIQNSICSPDFSGGVNMSQSFLAGTEKWAGTSRARPDWTPGAMRLLPLLRTVLWAALLGSRLPGCSSLRHPIYWNSSNPRLLRGDAVVELGFNDYLDIFCPHYESPGPPEGPETFALYMVDWSGYEACTAEGANAFQRWNCSMPFAPFSPVRFSEKIQRYTPFPLGFEFLPGETYYYISVPTPESPGRCLRLQVSVCCKESGSSHESAHPVGSPGESGTSGWRGGHAPSPLCLLLLLLLPILRLLRVL